MFRLAFFFLLLIQSVFSYGTEKNIISLDIYSTSTDNRLEDIYTNGTLEITPLAPSITERDNEGEFHLRERISFHVTKEEPFLVIDIITNNVSQGMVCAKEELYIYSSIEIKPCQPFTIGESSITIYASNTPIEIDTFSKLYTETENDIISDGMPHLHDAYILIKEKLGPSPTSYDISSEIVKWINNNISYEVRNGTNGPWESVASIIESGTADCKGMVVLIRSLLSYFGIESRTVYASTYRTEERITKEILLGYNHVIAYLPNEGIFLDATNKNLIAGEVSNYIIGQKLYIVQDGIFDYFRNLNRIPYFYNQETHIKESGDLLRLELTIQSFGKQISAMDLKRIGEEIPELYISQFLGVHEDTVSVLEWNYAKSSIRKLNIVYTLAIGNLDELLDDEGILMSFQSFPYIEKPLSIAHGNISVRNCDPLVQADYYIIDHDDRYSLTDLPKSKPSILSSTKIGNTYGIHIPEYIPQNECLMVDYFNARHDAIADLHSMQRLIF